MTEYHSTSLDLSIRIALGLEMMRPAKNAVGGGRQSWPDTTTAHGPGCTNWGPRTKMALEKAMKPGQAGRPVESKELLVDRDYLQRAITVMPMLTGSVRSIQIGLELLYGARRSVGHISQTLQAAGAAAKRQNGNLRLSIPVLGEADEIFVGRKPCLDGGGWALVSGAQSGRRHRPVCHALGADLLGPFRARHRVSRPGCRWRSGYPGRVARWQNCPFRCDRTCFICCEKAGGSKIGWKKPPTKPSACQNGPNGLTEKLSSRNPGPVVL